MEGKGPRLYLPWCGSADIGIAISEVYCDV